MPSIQGKASAPASRTLGTAIGVLGDWLPLLNCGLAIFPFRDDTVVFESCWGVRYSTRLENDSVEVGLPRLLMTLLR